jgi:hypothetical protein
MILRVVRLALCGCIHTVSATELTEFLFVSCSFPAKCLAVAI